MDEYTANEQAFKNGYEKGRLDALADLKKDRIVVLSKEEYERLLEQRRKARSEMKRFKRKYLYLKKEQNNGEKED